MNERGQLIIDYGSRIVSALLVTPAGELLPCSQEIRQRAARHVPCEILFDARAQDEDASDEAAVALADITPRNFFQRARRLGIRRFWDTRDSNDLLPLRSPLAVLSTSTALADGEIARVLPSVTAALIDALLDPLLTFVIERGHAPRDIDPIVIVSPQTGSRARRTVRALFRRRGFAPPTFLRREVATAMALLDSAPCECQIWDATDDDLHLYSVAIESIDHRLQLRTVRGETARGLGRAYWIQQIGAAMGEPSPAKLDRAITANTTGTAESPLRVTRASLQETLDHTWQWARSSELSELLAPSIEALGARDSTVFVTGDICAVEPVLAVYRRLGAGVSADPAIPVLDQRLRAVADAVLWLRAEPKRRLIVAPSGGLRINTFRGDAVTLLHAEQLPRAGESGYFTAEFDFLGERAKAGAFLLHLVWGVDRVPEGNATLCAQALDLTQANGSETLRLGVRLRRSRDGRRLHGTVDARLDSNIAAPPVSFTEEFSRFPSAGRNAKEVQ